MSRCLEVTLRLALLLAIAGSAPARSQQDWNFEAPPVHPIAVTSDGARLYVCHPEAGRVAELSLADPEHPVLLRELPVGLGPVSVRLRGSHELWVVQRISDSIAVVDLGTGHVVRTLPTVDDPCDLHLDERGGRVFVSSGSRDVLQVLDLATGREQTRISVPGAHPTVLLPSSSGTRLHVLVHESGNGTTIVRAGKAPAQPPPTKASLPGPPEVPKIVRADDPKWRPVHGVDLPDHDVVTVDLSSLSVVKTWRSVGTTNFDLVRDPGTGDLFVAGTDARNLESFEKQLRSRFVEHRVSRLGASVVQAIDLHAGVDEFKLPNDAARRIALAQPTGLAFDASGKELWLAAFGSDRVAVLDPASGRVQTRIELGDAGPLKAASASKRGPRSLVFHPSGAQVYVFQWLSASVAVLDTKSRSLVREVSIGDSPLSDVVRRGRGMLYDARLSGNGLASCAVCHVDGRYDGLAWDLGVRDGELRQLDTKTQPIVTFELHPMKGPLLTQTLLGVAGQEPYHWRGDRDNLFTFDQSFPDLLGGTLPKIEEMNEFVKYMESLRFPANPNLELDRSYPTVPAGESAKDGQTFFQNAAFAGGASKQRCIDCHARPSGSSAEIVVGRDVAQYMITPHLRGLYLRTRKRPDGNGLRRSGYGVSHAGLEDGVFELLGSELPFLGALRTQPKNRRMLERFLLAFDTGTAPGVGAELRVDVRSRGDREVQRRLTILQGAASKGEVDLLVRGLLQGSEFEAVYDPTTQALAFASSTTRPRSLASVVAGLAGQDELQFLGVAPGDAKRLGFDRDEDGRPDVEEVPLRYGRGDFALHGNGEARIGNSAFGLHTETLPARSRVFFAIGPTKTSRQVGALTLHVDPAGAILVEGRVDVRGTGVLALSIPPFPSLVGWRLYTQAFVASPSGLAASQGLEMQITR